jgi:signal transduction histidine kinase
MAATAKKSSLSNLLAELKDDVSQAGRAAWIVDPDSALLFPVNPAGRELFGGGHGDDDSMALDSTMPAVKTLRRIAHAPRRTRSSEKPHVLLFWTDQGPKRHLCYVKTHGYEHGILCLVVSAEDRQASQTDDTSPDDPPSEKDDAATLREIARQIRAGTAAPADTNATDQTLSGLKHRRPPTGTETPARPSVRHDTPTDETTTANEVTERPAARPPVRKPSLETNVPPLAQLAHELRTPIAAILSAAEILKEERLGVLENFRYRGYARDIYHSAENALALLNRTFESFRPPEQTPDQTARDQSQADPEIDLNQIAQHCLSTVGHLAAKKSLETELVLPQAPLNVSADKVIVSQILLNLLTNAIKFTPRGGCIVVRVGPSRNGQPQIEVEDTGSGMTETELQQILQPRPDLTPSRRKGGGLGIGLALSQALAERVGATLTLESQPNVGTRAALCFA